MTPPSDHLTYLESLRMTCRSELAVAQGLLELPVNDVERAITVVRSLQHALSQSLAMEAELRGIQRPVTTRG